LGCKGLSETFKSKLRVVCALRVDKGREGTRVGAHLPHIVDPVEVGCDLGVYSRGTRAPAAMTPAHDAHHLPLLRLVH
jgi:hypothetical protein